MCSIFQYADTAIWLLGKDKEFATRLETNGLTCLHLLAKMPPALGSSSHIGILKKILSYCMSSSPLPTTQQLVSCTYSLTAEISSCVNPVGKLPQIPIITQKVNQVSQLKKEKLIWLSLYGRNDYFLMQKKSLFPYVKRKTIP